MSNRIYEDLIGQKHGFLTVIRRLPGPFKGRQQTFLWEVICSCGNCDGIPYTITNKNFKRNNTCGFHKFIDLTGRKFGKLTVIKMADERIRGKIAWVCHCDCNSDTSDVILCSGSLLQDNTKSCGCNRRRIGAMNPRWIGIGDIPGSFFSNLRCATRGRNTKNRKLTLNVSKEYLWELFLKQNKCCVMTGRPLKFGFLKFNKKNRELGTASLDRIDSKKGYEEGNVQWVHKDVNVAKQDLLDEDFITLCGEIATGPKAQSLKQEPDFQI